uniref:Non-specific lipid-transfer protein 15 n=1 Tax=Lygus hesperus TaxID=30085 RepID=A0A0A9VQW7_LYGHE
MKVERIADTLVGNIEIAEIVQQVSEDARDTEITSVTDTDTVPNEELIGMDSSRDYDSNNEIEELKEPISVETLFEMYNGCEGVESYEKDSTNDTKFIQVDDPQYQQYTVVPLQPSLQLAQQNTVPLSDDVMAQPPELTDKQQ